MARQVRLLLMQVSLLGTAIALTLSGVFIFILVQSGWRPFAPRTIPQTQNFNRMLQDYDRTAAGGAPEETLGRLLSVLEKEALGIESHLSVLKRRRVLALDEGGGDGSRAAYRASAERAAGRFPLSEFLVAAAVEAAILDGAPERAAFLAESLEGQEFLPLALAASALAGEFQSLEQARTGRRNSGLLSLVSEFSVGSLRDFPVRNWELFTMDAALLRILDGDIQGASPLVQALSSSRAGGDAVSRRALYFSAEYHYDFGSPRRGAELFARIPGDRALSRQADSLALAGDLGAAKNLWTLLSSPEADGLVHTAPERLERSLYNLAATGEDAETRLLWLERLLRANPGHRYALIGYTRLLPADRAVAVLEGGELTGTEALLDLEWLRRKRGTWPVERTVPETWLLLNRHPESEPLSHWGIWYFNFQREYGESARLQRNLERRGGASPWLVPYQALALLREGKFAEGEELLRASEDAGGAPWQVPANLGRLLEDRRAPAAAFEQYREAAGRAEDGARAAQLLYLGARCLRAVGRDRDARAVLLEGLGLDGNNISIRMELSRLDDMGIF